jgi:predicted small lipoprotein YifL
MLCIPGGQSRLPPISQPDPRMPVMIRLARLAAVYAASLLLLLSGCGQKGPLYKPGQGAQTEGAETPVAREGAAAPEAARRERDSSPPDAPPTELGPLGEPTQTPY